jgi:formate hydrogenlyase subunit 3/multisubunit Na+/H+ antiporter MnhD subunit
VIEGLFLLLTLPLVMAGVVYILRRWASLSALLATSTALILGVALLVLPLEQLVLSLGDRQIAVDEAVTFLGRELVMEQTDQIAMAFLFLTTAGLFVLAWRFVPRSLLFPVGLSMLSLLSGALLIRPLIYATLLIEITAALSIFALQAEGQPPTRGGLHYLTLTTLALPGLLVIHWLMERYALTPDDTGLLDTAAILLLFSFTLLLGVVPFHVWVPAVGGGKRDGSTPLAGAFVLTVGNGAIWFLLLNFLEAYPELNSYPRLGSLVSNAGLAMVVVGGLLASAQRRLGRLMGYGALIDTGGALIALGMNSETGLSLIFLSLLVRPFGLILVATGLSGLQARNGGDDHLDGLQGLGREAPWSTTALIFGGLSIAGLPLSAGFVWRWALYRALSSSSLASALLLLLAGGGLMIGVWRALSVLLSHSQSSEDREDIPKEGLLTAVVVAMAIATCVGMGLFPQPLVPLATRLAGMYTFGGW